MTARVVPCSQDLALKGREKWSDCGREEGSEMGRLEHMQMQMGRSLERQRERETKVWAGGRSPGGERAQAEGPALSMRGWGADTHWTQVSLRSLRTDLGV